MLALLGFVTMPHNTVTWVAEDNVADGEERRKVAEANGTEPAAPDVNGFKAMEVPVVDVVANGAAIQDKMMMMKKKKAESQAAVHSQGW